MQHEKLMRDALQTIEGLKAEVRKLRGEKSPSLRDGIDAAFDLPIDMQPIDTVDGAAAVRTAATRQNREATARYLFPSKATKTAKARKDEARADRVKKARESDPFHPAKDAGVQARLQARKDREAEAIRKANRS